MRVQTEEWRKFVPGVRMYQGKKTLFYNGCPLIDYNGFPLVYSTEERKTWEVVILLPGVEVVPAYTFKECIKLESVIMNDDVKRLEEGCFCKCLFLVYISFSKNLQFIGRFVFYRCRSLPSLDLPSTCGEVDVLAFDGCDQFYSNATESKRRKTNHNADIEIHSNSSTFPIDMARAKKITNGIQHPSSEDDKYKLKRKSKELQREVCIDDDSRSIDRDHTTSSCKKEERIRDLIVKMKAIAKQYLEEISCLHGKFTSTEEQLQAKQRDHEDKVNAFLNDLSKLENKPTPPSASQKEERMRNQEDNLQTKQRECDRLIAQEKIYKNAIMAKEHGIKVLSHNNRILQKRLAELEHIGMLHQKEMNQMRQHESNLASNLEKKSELKQLQIDDLKKRNDVLFKRLESERKDKAVTEINKMYSDLTKAQSLLREQIGEKESEYNELVAMMDDKLTDLVDEKQKFELQLKEDEEDETTQRANLETLKIEDSQVNLTNKEDLDGAISFVAQVQQSFPHIYKEFLEILDLFNEQTISREEMIERVVKLFQGEKSVIQGFNAFLPDGFKILI
ncbi:predicted protein [Chaetoceros tenuissimus]|uniref:Uncharacterized protein n=1 Tax=Chaetoceros tenuissimus TaxID=426638 RepID=A0AAD3CTA5_9STRA|nr:predicted protein [Chaetoceros tenuissimus]